MSIFYCEECTYHIDDDYVGSVKFEGATICEECRDYLMTYKGFTIHPQDYWVEGNYMVEIDDDEGLSADTIVEMYEMINKLIETRTL